MSYYPDPVRDTGFVDGLKQVRFKMDQAGFSPHSTVWTRGNLDSTAVNHANLKMDAPKLFEYWQVRDVRTAVDLLSCSDTGYCAFSKSLPPTFTKHNPIHDCALDALMLKYYLEE